jgi:hypothetical protein
MRAWVMRAWKAASRRLLRILGRSPPPAVPASLPVESLRPAIAHATAARTEPPRLPEPADAAPACELLPFGDFVSEREEARFAPLPPISADDLATIDWEELLREIARDA